METIARYAAQQWGVSFEDALAELSAGAPEAAAYMNAALGMLRAGSAAITGFANPVAAGDITLGAQPPAAPAPPPGMPNASAPTAGDYASFYQSNDVMRVAQTFGTPVNAMPYQGMPGFTQITYADGSMRIFDQYGNPASPDGRTGAVSVPGALGVQPMGPGAAPAPRPPDFTPDPRGTGTGAGTPWAPSVRGPGIPAGPNGPGIPGIPVGNSGSSGSALRGR